MQDPVTKKDEHYECYHKHQKIPFNYQELMQMDDGITKVEIIALEKMLKRLQNGENKEFFSKE